MQEPKTTPTGNGHAHENTRGTVPSHLIGQVAQHFYGEPNGQLSKMDGLRFGSRGSLSVDLKKGVWFDHENNVGGGLLDLIEYKTGRKGSDRHRWLAEHGFISQKKERASGRIVATYDYRDADGRLRYQVQRLEPKRFRQRRPSPETRDGWAYNLDGVDPLPYRLPEVLEAAANGQLIVIVEGEKDADNLARIGIVASCNSGGAGNWSDGLTLHFSGAEIIIIGDNDDPGRDHAQQVVVSIAPVAASVRVLDLACHWPECPRKGDISDWLADGGTREQLDDMLEKATPWQAAAAEDSKQGETHQTHQTHHADALEIRLARGERARVLSEALALIRKRRDLFERGGELVRVTPEGIEPVADDWLLAYLDWNATFVGTRKRGDDLVDEPRDAPQWLGRRINAKKGERGLWELRAVITAQTMRADGTLLSKPGYDSGTGLLMLPGTPCPFVPEYPNLAELKAAAERLWRPFSEFPFVDDTARSVMMAAILTAVIRQTLGLAPGFTFDAPSAATGKTLLGFCLLALCGIGRQVIPECREQEEMRKRLLSTLRSGQPGILLDNIRGQFGSAALEAMLTTETYSDRLLGGSQMLALPTTALVLICGNNLRPAGDLWRRLLTCRIDAGVESPERRSFEIEPFEHCRKYRHEIVAAALTLLRGFVAVGSPRTTPDKLASFEVWDSRVRQAVIWIGKEELMPEAASVVDPAKAIDHAKVQEPERQKLAAFLLGVHAIMQEERWCVADIIKKSDPAVASPVGCEMLDNPIAMLRDALDEIAGDRGRINSRMLGRWIEKQADRRCGGRWLERSTGRAGVACWRVRS